jgi:DNA-3-methyladenine glycosylase I
VAYHDSEWGVPARDDRRLFEMLILEGSQAGLSWLTILRKREGYRRAFDGFDVAKIASYSQRDVRRLLADGGIVRNRLKIEAAVGNARGALTIAEEHGSLGAFLWRYVDGIARQNSWRTLQEIPRRTAESDAMSRDLTRRGFTFVGSTICYAFMQAVGMVNDHVKSCFRHADVRRLARGGMRARVPSPDRGERPSGSRSRE